ncbi:MAG TPA: hypothetical protein VMG30_14750 [Acidobacteriota bacterium]|nr:hypothetical protein [Acidobacteriota bacterium]
MTQKKQIARPFPRSAIGFLPEYLDFQKGIHVGNLEENQRITRILKLALEARYQESFVTERFGRGVYWQWIGFLPRSNRDAKSVSSKVSFGCSKFYLTIDSDERLFKCGFSVERGMIRPPADFPKIGLKPDWDWHRLLRNLTPSSGMAGELKRLVQREGFRVEAGNWDRRLAIGKGKFPSMAILKKALKSAPPAEWAGFQVYYPMPEKAVKSSSGVDLIESMMAIFEEVTPAMNLCMQIQLK